MTYIAIVTASAGGQTTCGASIFRGFLARNGVVEKIRTPALTSPQLQVLIAGLIEYHLSINHPSFLCRRSTRWLRRNEQARLYAHRSRNVLPRLKIELRM